MAMKKDANGNDILGSDDGQGQEELTEAQKTQAQLADLIAAQKKQNADLEIMREENQRLSQMLTSMREHPGDTPGNGSRRQPPRGSGIFSDPDRRSEFERQYSLPAEAADIILDEAVSRVERAQREREEAVRNQTNLKNDFFKAYPDLVGYEPIIRDFADKCAADHPDWTAQKGFAEVAKNTREYIKAKFRSSSSGDELPPNVLPSGSHRNDGGSGRLPGSDEEKPTRQLSQDEEIAAEMDERRKNRTKAL